MKRALMVAGVLAGALFCLTDTSFGHGGQYRGPGDTVPPNLGGGGDTTPPGNPGGPGTPGPGAPQTGARPGAGTGGGPVVPGGGGGAARPKTGGFTKRSSGAGFEQWEFWWAHNKEPYLNLRQRLKEGGVQSGSAALAVGRGKEKGVSTTRVTPEIFKRDILPILLNTLNTETDADIVDSAVLAVARSLPAEDADAALDTILKTLGHKQDSAKQSATLSLGVLGNAQARKVLQDLVQDNGEARNHLRDGKAVPSIIRGFAAISLGMIGDPQDIELLKNSIDRLPDSELDLKSCAIVALGMFQEKQDEVIPYLIDVMGRRQMNRMLRSLAPIALSRLDQNDVYAAALGPLLQKARSDKTDDDMMRSCVIALGELANMSDQEVIDALYSTIEDHSDQQTRHFAYIALGKIAGRDNTTEKFEANKAAHDKLMKVLLRDVTRPKKGTHQPWAGLALSLYTREMKDVSAESVGNAMQKIEEVFEKTNNPSYKGAMAISLGLLQATGAAQKLERAMDKSNDQALNGYIALSLGLMNYTQAAEKLRSRVTQKGIEFKFRLNLARGLGLMNDVQSIQTLVDLLSKSKTLSETASIAQAIGLIGDRAAIGPLSDLLQNKKEKELVRAFAAVALGLLSEKNDLPWNAPISVGLNYRSKTEAISEILDIL